MSGPGGSIATDPRGSCTDCYRDFAQSVTPITDRVAAPILLSTQRDCTGSVDPLVSLGRQGATAAGRLDPSWVTDPGRSHTTCGVRGVKAAFL
jgi:hypothetical protein